MKVPGISIANVWTGPAIEPTDTAKPVDAKEAELVSRLAARRTPMEDARKLIADYVVGTDTEKQEKAKTLFAALYSKLNAQRDEVMNGIERFSRKQKVAAMTQQLATVFEQAIRERPEDWHMLQKLFDMPRVLHARVRITSPVRTSIVVGKRRDVHPGLGP